jgi:hypothetical protein
VTGRDRDNGLPMMTARAVAWRLFFTAWIVFVLHFATDVVREHYPALAIGDHFSFNLEEYCGLHPDLFETPGYGCHIGNNPGVSMLAAIPYALARPIIDPIVARVKAKRAASGSNEPPVYNSPWPNARRFYAEAWKRGLDIKLGLAAFVMQAFCMAPSSALGVVLVFFALLATLKNQRQAMWLALLYAFGTPVFFRTGFLNHNLMLGHIAFAGLLAVWNPWGWTRLTPRTRDVLCGVAAGTTILFDYTGAVIILALGAYVVIKHWREGGMSVAWGGAVRFVLGTIPPVLLLWFYQYEAFGNPFLPGQHWMPAVEFIERGYQGYQFPPVPSLLGMLVLDYRFGLFVCAPILLLALIAPFVDRGADRRLPALEMGAMLGVAAIIWLFFGGNNYTRLEFNTGIRYMAPVLPFMFVPAAMVLVRMRPRTAYAWALLSLVIAWPLAMYREVEKPLGVFDPVVRTFSGGFALPALETLSQTSGQYGDFFAHGVSAIPLFCFAGAVIYGIWAPWSRRRSPV